MARATITIAVNATIAIITSIMIIFCHFCGLLKYSPMIIFEHETNRATPKRMPINVWNATRASIPDVPAAKSMSELTVSKIKDTIVITITIR